MSLPALTDEHVNGMIADVKHLAALLRDSAIRWKPILDTHGKPTSEQEERMRLALEEFDNAFDGLDEVQSR